MNKYHTMGPFEAVGSPFEGQYLEGDTWKDCFDVCCGRRYSTEVLRTSASHTVMIFHHVYITSAFTIDATIPRTPNLNI